MPIISRYRWNANSRRYIGPDGRFVPASTIRDEVDEALDAARKRAQTTAQLFRERAISVDVWRDEMRQIIKEIHLYSASAAEGGWAQLSPSDYGRVGRIVRDEYAWLERFAGEIEDGLTLDGRFLARVELYTEAGRMTYHLIERASMEESGMTEELSMLNPADHCGECIGEAAADWSPIGTRIPIGRRECGRRCKCQMSYR
jgi:hypothetical protein